MKKMYIFYFLCYLLCKLETGHDNERDIPYVERFFNVLSLKTLFKPLSL